MAVRGAKVELKTVQMLRLEACIAPGSSSRTRYRRLGRPKCNGGVNDFTRTPGRQAFVGAAKTLQAQRGEIAAISDGLVGRLSTASSPVIRPSLARHSNRRPSSKPLLRDRTV